MSSTPMTIFEIEEDALQCWDVWRSVARSEGRNVGCMPNLEVWVIAYVAGLRMGRNDERGACAALADGLGAGFVSQVIQARDAMDEER